MSVANGLKSIIASIIISGSSCISTNQSKPILDGVSAGNLYFFSEHSLINKDKLQNIADITKENFSSVGIMYSNANTIDSFPVLKPLDALVIYLDNAVTRDLGFNKDDCPLENYRSGESDILSEQSYDMMKERFKFNYDKQTVRGAVVYVCPGRLIFAYRLHTMLERKEDSIFTEKKVDLLLSSIATHEIAHTIGGTHVLDKFHVPARGYFLGSFIEFTNDSIKFHKLNILKMKKFISNARTTNADMQSLNNIKSVILFDYIIEK